MASASTSRSSSAHVHRRPVANSTRASRSGYAATVRLEVLPDRLLEQRRLELTLARTTQPCAERTPGWSAVGRVCRVTSTDSDKVESGQKQRPLKAHPRDRAPAGVRDRPGPGREDLLRAVLLHPLGVDGARAHRQRPDPGREAVVLGQRRAAARRRHRLRRPGRLAQRPRGPAAHVAARPRAGQDRSLPDRRPPREAGDRGRGRHRRVLRRPGPDHGQRAARRRGRLHRAPEGPAEVLRRARCPAARWTATGPPARCRPAPSS